MWSGRRWSNSAGMGGSHGGPVVGRGPVVRQQASTSPADQLRACAPMASEMFFKVCAYVSVGSSW